MHFSISSRPYVHFDPLVYRLQVSLDIFCTSDDCNDFKILSEKKKNVLFMEKRNLQNTQKNDGGVIIAQKQQLGLVQPCE